VTDASSPSASSTRLPPGPRFAAWQTMRLMRDPYGYYAEMRRRYGDPFTVPALNGTVVMTARPEAIKQIFTADPSTYSVFASEALGPIVGEGSLLLSFGSRHARDRKLLTPPFHGARMRAYGAAMQAATLARIERWEAGSTFPMQEETQRITLDVILRTIFGVDAASADFERARALLIDVIGGFSPLIAFARALQQPWFPPWKRFVKARTEYDAFVRAQIAARRTASGPAKEDILGMLLEARYEDGAAMSDAELADQLLTLLVAGHETTAISLAWAVYWLLRTPEALAKVREELAPLGRDPDPDALAKLPYLSAVVLEAMRLYPILPDVVRKLVSPLEIAGVTVPAGMHVGFVACEVHQDPAIYPEPARFRPERFLDKKPGPFEYLPFGGGHRRCIGAAFSEHEQRVVLGTMLARFELALVSSEPERPVRRNVTMGPEHGVRVRVVRAR
jgi:cytochrome P450